MQNLLPSPTPGDVSSKIKLEWGVEEQRNVLIKGHIACFQSEEVFSF